jgi:predicted O-methyltransferase YrrM
MNKTLNELEFQITEESINILNNIVNNIGAHQLHNHNHILYDICNSIEHDDVTYFEIGSYAGASASLMSSNPKVKKSYSLDNGDSINKEVPINNVNRFKHNDCVYEHIEGDSANDEIVKLVNEKVNNVDILYIDGDHSESYVINDFNNYEKIVKKNGYIVFDDYMDNVYCPQVFGAVNDIVRNLNPNEYKIIGSIQYDLIQKTNCPYLKSSNLFIIKKI